MTRNFLADHTMNVATEGWSVGPKTNSCRRELSGLALAHHARLSNSIPGRSNTPCYLDKALPPLVSAWRAKKISAASIQFERKSEGLSFRPAYYCEILWSLPNNKTVFFLQLGMKRELTWIFKLRLHMRRKCLICHVKTKTTKTGIMCKFKASPRRVILNLILI